MTKAQTAERLEAIAQLREWLKPGDTLYTILDSVSRSGMSRHIRMVIPYVAGPTIESVAPGGQLSDYIKRADIKIDHLHPNHSIALAIGARQVKRGDGLVIGGCGMDMGFHVVYSTSEALYGYLRCEVCGKVPIDSHADGLTARPPCEQCGAILSGGYQCLGKGCPSNYHSNHRSEISCPGVGTGDDRRTCYAPTSYGRFPAPEGWPRRTIEIDGEQVEVGYQACLTSDDESTPPEICPTCQGAGSLPNPAGPERFDLLHTDGYAIHHRWL